MFGKNDIVGGSFFREAPADSLMVTSKFWSLQGEGPFMGQPAYFFRLSKCNLRCHFCDAFFDQGEYYTYDELYQKMVDETPDWFSNFGLVVITGGEPLLQPNLFGFIAYLNERNFRVQIETNGILLNKYRHEVLTAEDLTVVCSPKCSEKTGEYLKLPEENQYLVDCLKFVVSADETSPYNKLPGWLDDWVSFSSSKVYVSPMNEYTKKPEKARGKGDITQRSTKDEVIDFWADGNIMDKAANELNHKFAAKLAMENGYRFQLQMHLFAGLA